MDRSVSRAEPGGGWHRGAANAASLIRLQIPDARSRAIRGPHVRTLNPFALFSHRRRSFGEEVVILGLFWKSSKFWKNSGVLRSSGGGAVPGGTQAPQPGHAQGRPHLDRGGCKLVVAHVTLLPPLLAPSCPTSCLCTHVECPGWLAAHA